MRKNKTFMVVGLLIAVLCLGIGYAAISSVTLNISGTASATASDDNFKVVFDSTVTPTTTISRGTGVSASITSDLVAAIEVSGLTTKGDYATATYTIINNSSDLSADLSIGTISNGNEDYFTVTAVIDGSTTIGPSETTTVTVTVTLIATPVDDQTATISVPIVADPVE